MWDADAVVFAVGVRAMQGIVNSSPDLAACPVGISLTQHCSPPCIVQNASDVQASLLARKA